MPRPAWTAPGPRNDLQTFKGRPHLVMTQRYTPPFFMVSRPMRPWLNHIRKYSSLDTFDFSLSLDVYLRIHYTIWDTFMCQWIHFRTDHISMYEKCTQPNTIQYNPKIFNTTKYNSVQPNAYQYNSIQPNTIQYDQIRFNTTKYQ